MYLVSFSKFSQLCNHLTTRFFKKSNHNKTVPSCLFEISPFSHPPNQAVTNLPIVSIDRFSIKISYKWNHAIGNLIYLASFAWHNVYLGSSMLLQVYVVLFIAEQYSILWLDSLYVLEGWWTLDWLQFLVIKDNAGYPPTPPLTLSFWRGKFFFSFDEGQFIHVFICMLYKTFFVPYPKGVELSSCLFF